MPFVQIFVSFYLFVVCCCWWGWFCSAAPFPAPLSLPSLPPSFPSPRSILLPFPSPRSIPSSSPSLPFPPSTPLLPNLPSPSPFLRSSAWWGWFCRHRALPPFFFPTYSLPLSPRSSAYRAGFVGRAFPFPTFPLFPSLLPCLYPSIPPFPFPLPPPSSSPLTLPFPFPQNGALAS